ncbi:MAG: LamG domain-containing protein [Polyangiales bacterium]
MRTRFLGLLAVAFLSLASACDDGPTDYCPDDLLKTQAGACGCGVSDEDANANGVPDCLDSGIDLCPNDPQKTQAGTCGCGMSDADANANGVPDCLDSGIDLCPNDATKTVPGTCGCAVSDADANSNGVPDCLDAGIDLCPNDAAKTVPGTCGCGVSDADANSNGVPDCLDAGIDLCPNDPQKTQAGTCGCGVSDADANSNGVPDCVEANIDFYTNVVMRSGPIAYWPLDEVGGTTAVDVVGGRVATAVGTVRLGAPTPVSGGASARSAVFDGTSYLELGAYDSSLNPSTFTVEVWARDDGLTGMGSPITMRSSAGCGATRGFTFYSLRNIPRWDAYTGADGLASCWQETFGPPPVRGRFTHLVLTWDGTTMRWYVDGVLSGSSVTTYKPSTTAPLRIGAGTGDTPAPDYFWTGAVDNVALYDRPLSASEIAQHRAAGVVLSSLTSGATASQSSDYTSGCASRPAGVAVDGRFAVNGGPCDQVSHTNADANAFWQLDLPAARTVARVNVWPYLLGSTGTFVLRHRASSSDAWVSETFTAAPNWPSGVAIPLGTAVRQLRIERTDGTACTGALNDCAVSLSEVEVLGL